jgi:hypothetical protein
MSCWAFRVPFSFTKAIQRGVGITTAHSSGRTGLYSGCMVAEQVALGAKYPAVLLLLTAFSVFGQGIAPWLEN